MMNIKLKLASVAIPACLAMAGCNSANIQSAVQSAANGIIQSTLPQPVSGHTASTGYSIANERIDPFKATRTSRDFGNISLRTEKNPQGLTLVKLVSVSQLSSGGEFKSGFANLFPVSPEGWLSEKKTYTAKKTRPAAINGGLYYLKGTDHGQDFYASGEITLKTGVTNLISISIE